MNTTKQATDFTQVGGICGHWYWARVAVDANGVALAGEILRATTVPCVTCARARREDTRHITWLDR